MSSSSSRSSRTRRLFVALVLLSGFAGLALAIGLFRGPNEVENRDPTGERLPTAEGRSLTDEVVRFPADLSGAPALLLVGYVQEAQFDADRWLYGLLQAELPLRILEVPTIPGLFPRALAGVIDEGMRGGIPEEDWASVVTLYGEGAEALRAFTGNESPRNMRVLLVDAEGEVVWFHDRGFSAAKLIEIGARAAEL